MKIHLGFDFDGEDLIRFATACIALAPKSAGFFYNRAQAETQRGRFDKALADYDRAIDLDPSSGAALINRGVLHYRYRRLPEALLDFHSALDQGADAALVHYNLALVHAARQDKATALASLRKALQADPGHKDSLLLQKQLAH